MNQTLSPLRYPGGKSNLYQYTKKLINHNDLIGCTYAEPFAGGCGLALKLLHENIVDKLILNDIDRSIYAFWITVLNDCKRLVDKIESTPITISEWHKQKEIQNNKAKANLFDLGFSTLFLNRTNFSGIIKAGPLGGIKQNSKYKLDCRFNKKNIIKKIELIYNYRDRIRFYNEDAIDFLEILNTSPPNNELLVFLDPPYFVKGSGLYTNFYKKKDHQILANKIEELNFKWLVTYDNIDEIKEIYSNYNQQEYDINYSANKNYTGSEIMIYSDDILPLSI